MQMVVLRHDTLSQWPLVFFQVLNHVEHCKVALLVLPKGPIKQSIPSKGQKGWSKGS